MIDRLRDRWIIAGMCYAGFVLVYGLTGHFPPREPIVLTPSSFDDVLGVHPHSIWIYLSQFGVIAMAITACPERARLICAARAALIACSISFCIFLAWPTTVPRPAVIACEPARSAYLLLYGVDPATNCFPSLHASLAVIAFYALATSRWRHLILVWCLLILVSTITTGQHRLADVTAGLGIAVCSLMVAQRWNWPPAQRDPSARQKSRTQADPHHTGEGAI